MSTTYESVSDLAEALRRAAEAHGKHEERTGEEDPDWFVSEPARSCRHEQRI